MDALIVGAGGQGRVILDILRAECRHESIAFIDDNPATWGRLVNGAPIVGGLESLRARAPGTFAVIVALGNGEQRLAIGRSLLAASVPLLNAVHPSAVIMQTGSMGQGNMIGAGAVINTDVRIANHAIVNSAALIEHDAVLEDAACICPGARVSGRTRIREGAFVATGAIVLPRLTIGAWAIVSAGSVVTRDVPEKAIVRGAPARVVATIEGPFDWKRVL